MEPFVAYLWVVAQQVLEYVLPILATQLAILLGAWIVKEVNEIKAKMTADQLEILQNAVDIAVQAAEQMNLHGAIQDKKQLALTIAQNYLDANGVKIDLKTIEAAIEAAVYANFNVGREREVEG